MRVPIFRVVCDDDPSDCRYPCGVSLDDLGEEPDVYADAAVLPVGESMTVGGGAGVQFTLTRIR